VRLNEHDRIGRGARRHAYPDQGGPGRARRGDDEHREAVRLKPLRYGRHIFVLCLHLDLIRVVLRTIRVDGDRCAAGPRIARDGRWDDGIRHGVNVNRSFGASALPHAAARTAAHTKIDSPFTILPSLLLSRSVVNAEHGPGDASMDSCWTLNPSAQRSIMLSVSPMACRTQPAGAPARCRNPPCGHNAGEDDNSETRPARGASQIADCECLPTALHAAAGVPGGAAGDQRGGADRERDARRRQRRGAASRRGPVLRRAGAGRVVDE